MKKLLGSLAVFALFLGAPAITFACGKEGCTCTGAAKDKHAQNNETSTSGAKELSRAKIEISGMSCGNCAERLESKLRNIDGVFEVGVSYKQGNATIMFDSDKTSADEIVDAIGEAHDGKFDGEVIEVSQVTVGESA